METWRRRSGLAEFFSVIGAPVRLCRIAHADRAEDHRFVRSGTRWALRVLVADFEGLAGRAGRREDEQPKRDRPDHLVTPDIAFQRPACFRTATDLARGARLDVVVGGGCAHRVGSGELDFALVARVEQEGRLAGRGRLA